MPESHDAGTLDLLEARIQREIRRLERAAHARLDAPSGAGDSADVAASLAEREGRAEQISRASAALAEWTDALVRLRAHPETFGRCEACGTLIPAERLDLLPTARLCRSCGE